jgi:hypothetical protein
MYLAKDREREKKEGLSSFVLPEITNMCTYNVRANGFFFHFFNLKIFGEISRIYTTETKKIPKISQFLCQKIAKFSQ